MSFRPDPVALDRVLRGSDGPVVRDIQRRTRNVQLKAKQVVGKNTHMLERNIVTRVELHHPRGVAGRVIAGEQLPDARAIYQQFGTRPHVITPKQPGGTLSFTVQGKRRFARSVQHPGTTATRFMTIALEEARR
jgi:hypothetical protein